MAPSRSYDTTNRTQRESANTISASTISQEELLRNIMNAPIRSVTTDKERETDKANVTGQINWWQKEDVESPPIKLQPLTFNRRTTPLAITETRTPVAVQSA